MKRLRVYNIQGSERKIKRKRWRFLHYLLIKNDYMAIKRLDEEVAIKRSEEKRQKLLINSYVNIVKISLCKISLIALLPCYYYYYSC
jgi:hypothetical protein